MSTYGNTFATERAETKVFDPSEAFFSQFSSEINAPTSVKRALCGLASMASAVSIVQRNRTDVNTLIDEFIERGRYTTPRVVVDFDKRNKYYPVSLVANHEDPCTALQRSYNIVRGLDLSGKEPWKLRIDETVSLIYAPTYTIENGTDSRGVVQYLRSRGLGAALMFYSKDVKDTKINDIGAELNDRDLFINIFETLYSGRPFTMGSVDIPHSNERALIASLKISNLNYPSKVKYLTSQYLPSTHLVTAFGPCESGICFMDPAMTEIQNGIQIKSADSFVNTMCPPDAPRAHFTVVWNQTNE